MTALVKGEGRLFIPGVSVVDTDMMELISMPMCWLELLSHQLLPPENVSNSTATTRPSPVAFK